MEHVGVLGASGSVMSVVTLFGALFPKQIVYIYFVLPVPVRRGTTEVFGLNFETCPSGSKALDLFWFYLFQLRKRRTGGS
jgi:hypothetical protein